MLLVRCPYCGERPEIEFRSWRGSAHRATRGSRRTRATPSGRTTFTTGRNPKGLARRALAPCPWLRPFLQCACATPSAISFSPPTRSANPAGPARCRAGRRLMNALSACRTAGRIDRSKPLRFTFDGRTYEGFAGDTLASALIANGVHLVGRSFKYHRPRGILAPARTSRTRLVTLVRDEARHTPNLPATQVELYDGLAAESQNRWPSLAFRSCARANDLSRRSSPPASTTRPSCGRARPGSSLYEPRIRAHGGPRARADAGPIRTATRSRYAHCDVLVVGAGPAGLAAALAAAECGAHVMLCDEQAEFGGSLLREATASDRRQAGTGLARRDPRGAHDRTTMSCCCRARRRSAITRTTCSALPSG